MTEEKIELNINPKGSYWLDRISNEIKDNAIKQGMMDVEENFIEDALEEAIEILKNEE